MQDTGLIRSARPGMSALGQGRVLAAFGLGLLVLGGLQALPGPVPREIPGFLGALALGLAVIPRLSRNTDLARLVTASTQELYVTDRHGRITLRSPSATPAATSLAGALMTAEAPDPATLDALVHRARAGRLAETELITRRGRLRLRVILLGGRRMLWTVTRLADAPSAPDATGEARLPMLRLGRDDTIVFMNAAARALLGETPATLADIFGPDGVRNGEAAMLRTAQGARQCVATMVEADGRRDLYILPTEVPVMKQGAILFDELPVALLKVRPDGRVALANRAACALAGRPIDDSTTLSDLMQGLGRSITDWLAEAAAGHGRVHSEFLRLSRDDREVIVQVTLNRVVEGEATSLIAVLNDATELKTLEAQFVQSQKMQAIGQLAGGVAHDFNNLLTAISGHCDLLLLRHDHGDQDYADLVQINENANRAAALVGQLLAFSRKQTLRPEVIDLRDTLADLTHLLNRLVGEKIALSLEHDPAPCTIRADKRQLEQVLMNLVVNARDAMPDGGEIRILTENLDLEDPLKRDRAVVPEGRYVCVKVSDEGSGIPPDKLQKVFEPFFTTKRTGEGTGLGLSTAYGIVKQTGGYIFADSLVGTGSCFTLLFPANEIYECSDQEDAPDPPRARADAGSGLVLLVEDEAPVRSFASRALRMRGFTVLEAGSGEEALALLDDPALNVDLFVTDVVMPGLDGPGWVRRARQDRADVPVIFMSGYAEDSFGEGQARIARAAFLPKPFSLDDLVKAVQDNIRTRQTIPA